MKIAGDIAAQAAHLSVIPIRTPRGRGECTRTLKRYVLPQAVRRELNFGRHPNGMISPVCLDQAEQVPRKTWTLRSSPRLMSVRS